MGWNGSDGVAVDAARGFAAAKKRRSATLRCTVCGLVVAIAVAGCAVVWLLSTGSSETATSENVKTRKIAEKRVETVVSNSTSRSVGDEKRRVREMLEEAVSGNVKEFVRKAATNQVQWLNKPMDPDDPDHALLNRVCAEIGTLLASEPGDVMIPWPYTFLDEDEAKERGIEVESDGGTKEFLDSLKKYRIAVKDGDSEERIAYKEKMAAAQMELLEGISAGISVNDSIRAAYEFRKHAYELRSNAINTMRTFLEEGDTVENTREVLKAMNARLKEEGIRTISEEDIGIEPGEDTEGNSAEEAH